MIGSLCLELGRKLRINSRVVWVSARRVSMIIIMPIKDRVLNCMILFFTKFGGNLCFVKYYIIRYD